MRGFVATSAHKKDIAALVRGGVEPTANEKYANVSIMLPPRWVQLDANINASLKCIESESVWTGDMTEADMKSNDGDVESDSGSEVEEGDVSKGRHCGVAISEDAEKERNALLKEALWLNVSSSRPTSAVDISSCDDSCTQEETENDLDDLPTPPPALSEVHRQTSVTFVKRKDLSALANIDQILTFKDKAGNTAAHHAAFIGLKKTYETLLALGASKYVLNNANICPEAIRSGVGTLFPRPSRVSSTSCRTGEHILPMNTFNKVDAIFFRKLTRRRVIPEDLVPVAFRAAAESESPLALIELQQRLLNMDSVSCTPVAS